MNYKPRIFNSEVKVWHDQNGEYHRDGDLPAIEWPDKRKSWYKHGLRHREQDKPAIERADGTKAWYKNGKELLPQQVKDLKRKWEDIRNGNTDLLAEELLNDL